MFSKMFSPILHFHVSKCIFLPEQLQVLFHLALLLDHHVADVDDEREHVGELHEQAGEEDEAGLEDVVAVGGRVERAHAQLRGRVDEGACHGLDEASVQRVLDRVEHGQVQEGVGQA